MFKRLKNIRHWTPRWVFVQCLHYVLRRYNKQFRFLLCENMDFLKETLKYALHNELPKLHIPTIKTAEETVDELLSRRVSIVRFGDGEIDTMMGRPNVFQQPNPMLADRLKAILSSDRSDILIGIKRSYYYLDTHCDHEHMLTAYEHRGFLEAVIRKGVTYYEACLSIPFVCHSEQDAYYQKLRQLWEKRNVVVVCGRYTFKYLRYNIFDNAVEVRYQYAPEREAFAEYDAILQQALTIDKQSLVVVMLGTTATVLAYDLALKGYQALDLGHIAKSYDYFKQHKPIDEHFFSWDLK